MSIVNGTVAGLIALGAAAYYVNHTHKKVPSTTTSDKVDVADAPPSSVASAGDPLRGNRNVSSVPSVQFKEPDTTIENIDPYAASLASWEMVF